MTEAYQTSSPIIPVIDERLGCQASAPADHKVKVEKYNELLEDIYQREIELTKLKSALVDMRDEIVEEARTFNKTSDETPEAVDEDNEVNENETEESSDNSSSSNGKSRKKVYKKTKGKSKSHIKRSKMADAELDAEWDYKLELIQKEAVPLRAKQRATMSVVHSKRSFGKYPKMIESPAYDASEEDNDPLTDDAHSAISVPIAISRHSNTSTNPRTSHPKPSTAFRGKHYLAHNLLSDSDAGVDSPTYDGDVESSTTAGPDTTQTSHKLSYHHHHSTSSVSTLNTPITAPALNPPSIVTPSNEQPNPISHAMRATNPDSNHPVFISPPMNANIPPQIVADDPAAPTVVCNPAALTPEDIQSFIAKAILGEPGRRYKINPPPVGRSVRVYAGGIYDLFHFGHALQLRQAKLSFPSVYLLVGVYSDEIVAAHKGPTIMTHAERLEAVRHCCGVDEIVSDAPWIIDEDFIKKHDIDYVAHDEEAASHDDVFSYVKSQGKFIPTRRTPGISTSVLLQRMFAGYQQRVAYDDGTLCGTSSGHKS